MERTVLGAASVEAKKSGVKTGMAVWEAKKICPNLILVRGDSDKYLACTKRFLNILKDYSPYLEVFSIDEVFLELVGDAGPADLQPLNLPTALTSAGPHSEAPRSSSPALSFVRGDSEESSRASTASVPETSEDAPERPSWQDPEQLIKTAQEIKQRIRAEIGEWITVSIGISYNKLMAKLAGSLQKPDGLVIIADTEAAQIILDQVELDDICGIGHRIKHRLNNMGIFNFSDLRQAPKEALLASFKSYGEVLYSMARGIDLTKVTPFYEKEEIKSVGHRLTLDHDTNDDYKIKQVLLKLAELVGRRLRAKKLTGKTINLWYRSAFNREYFLQTGHRFYGDGMQSTIAFTCDGMAIFKAAWKIFLQIWDREVIGMIGVSVSNLKPLTPQNLSLLEGDLRQDRIIKALDRINDRFGEFILKRGVLLNSQLIKRMPNPFLSDRRFKI